MLDQLKADGLENVHGEQAEVCRIIQNILHYSVEFTQRYYNLQLEISWYTNMIQNHNMAVFIQNV